MNATRAQTRLLDQNIRDRGTLGYEALYLYELYTGHYLKVLIRRALDTRQCHAKALLLPAETPVVVAEQEEWLHLLPPYYVRSNELHDQLAEIALSLVDEACHALEHQPASTGTH